LQFLAGAVGTLSSKEEILKGLEERLAGRSGKDVILAFCNGGDYCNGSGRLAEISTMMILLPASLVLLISFFSRL